MTDEIANSENTITMRMEAIPTTTSAPYVQTAITSEKTTVSSEVSTPPSHDEYKASSLKTTTKATIKTPPLYDKTILSVDVETTGINPWDYKMVGCSVWDLNEPKAEMKSFFGWDEEKVCQDLFEYISSKKPDVLLAFNAKFENRCFISRAMLYHIAIPWWYTCEWHDLMTILEGGWKNGLSGTMPTGTEEQWLDFFFGEKKPYTIEECFEGVRNGSLKEFIIRNRTCVEGQGDIYQLFQFALAPEGVKIAEEKPSFARIDEMRALGMVLEKCTVCDAVNEITDVQNPGQCWRCQANLPEPTDKTIIKETTRPVDWSKVGITEKKTTTTNKSTTTTKKSKATA